ncbi:MAG: efflux RND transporter permease subunit [Candidatus Euphemobacter frigidus]|nr:efflux RND transporter permease subunit [Candidatus Euphemobacter frigidus]
MAFSEKFIRRPIMTILIMVTLLLGGLVAYTQLPVSDLPSVDYPVMTITVSYPGASPELMASSCASPIEDECMQIPGLQTIISDNKSGITTITLSFELDKNVDLAAPDVQAAITRAQANLPSLPQPPTYDKSNPADQPIIYIMLSCETMTGGELYDYAHKSIGQRINMIEGITKVAIYGAKRAIRVLVDPEKLASLGIGLDEVAQALSTGTPIVPGGDLNGVYRTFSIYPEGQLTEPEEYEELIIAYRNDAPIRIRDVGHAIDSLQSDVVNVTYGNKEHGMIPGSVCVAATRASGANTVALSGKVRALLDEIAPTLPGALKVGIFYDKALQIEESIKDVETTIVIAFILVVLIIFLFLGRLSDTMIPAAVLPVTLFGTFLIMMFAGFSLDNLSLMSLTLSIGFLVDDAIVVLENTVRHIQAGEKPQAAAIKSMEEITGTVISTSIALVVVFIPLVFMAGVVGRNFKEFALTVIFAISVSTVMALTLSPMMCARVLKGGKKAKTRIEKFSDRFIKFIVNKYAVSLRWFLKRRFLAILGGLACMVGIVYFFIALPKTFMPVGDSGLFYGQFEALQGTSTDQIRRFQDRINEIITDNPAVRNLLSVTGNQTGADQSTGVVIATLVPTNEREPIETVVKEVNMTLYSSLSDLGQVYIMPLPSLVLSSGAESTATGSKYSYVVSGQDREAVYQAAFEMEDRMRKLPYFSGIQNSVKLDLPQLNIILRRDRASALGITAADIETAMAYCYAKGKTAMYLTDVDQYWVILEAEDKDRLLPRDLSKIYVRSSGTGKFVPLGSIADWVPTVAPQNVPHHNQLNAATISYNLAPGVPLGDATQALNKMVRDILPPEVSGVMQGQAQEFEEAVQSLIILMIVAVFIMYVILGILYESYIHPFTVLTTLPPAAFGGLLTLYIFGSELSMYSYIGVFMLLGIVSKNGIMMVDFAKQNLEEGQNAFDSIYNACLTRFRPILMTGASTIMGTLPIAIGLGADASARRPLGLLIVGGLAFAQVVTLFITPGIFLYMQSFQEKFLDRFELTRSDACRLKMQEADETDG